MSTAGAQSDFGTQFGVKAIVDLATAATAPAETAPEPASPETPALTARPAGLRGRIPARSRRITLLLTAVVLVSLADLVMTLTFLMNFGLSEANPLARGIMSYRSPALVVLWKLASVTACAGIIYRLRTVRCAEIAAWVAFGVMIWLSFQWAGYLYYMDRMLAYDGDPGEVMVHENWVTMAAAVAD